MTRQLKIFWTGILLYVVSFFLFAVGWRNSGPRGPWPIPGIVCAYVTAGASVGALLHGISTWPYGGGILASVSYLVAGWINPVFLVTAFLDLTGLYSRRVDVLRIIVFVMIPFCWIFFHFEGLRPREGHYLWVFGMLLVLCSHWLAKPWERAV